MKRPKFPLEVKRGSASVKIYSTPFRGEDRFTVAYWLHGVRKRQTFMDLVRARAEAEIIAIQLTHGDLDVAALTSADRAAYLRANELVAPTGVPLELAASQFADAVKRLGAIPLANAVDYYLERHKEAVVPRTVREVADEFLAAKRQDRLSERYLKTLRFELNQFTGKFEGPLASLRGVEVEAWLRGTGWAPRTRNNFRNTLQTFFNFAKGKRYVPREFDELEAVSTAKQTDGEIEIYTPQELTDLLAVSEARFIPFLVLGAFAGVRHSEIQRLEWPDVRLEDGVVEIRAGKAKTASRRVIPILPNLRAWLEPHRLESGPVCAYRSMSCAFTVMEKAVNAERLKRAELPGAMTEVAEFVWKHNALRHSFISYRVAQTQNVAQVALEAGNSPQMIFQHYRELVRPAAAKEWFAIVPKG